MSPERADTQSVALISAALVRAGDTLSLLPTSQSAGEASSHSTTSATALTRSSSLRFITRTPWVARPIREMPLT